MSGGATGIQGRRSIGGRLERLAPRRELAFVAAAIVLAIALRVGAVLLAGDLRLAGDEPTYDEQGRFAAEGKILWGSVPYGDPHPTTFKVPGYGAWLGLLYALGVDGPRGAVLVQAVVLAPFAVGFAWLLGRTLFTPAVGVATAFVVAVYPNAWQFDIRLMSESLASPLTVLALVLVLGARTVTVRRAVAAGVVLGLLLLLKPSSVLLVAPIAVMWWGLSGFRRGTARIALTGVVALLVITPWVVRNYTLDSEHFVPLSVQSAAAYGVFNDEAANDPDLPYAWRPLPAHLREELLRPRSDGELYRYLNGLTRDYIAEHPGSVPKAFFWNGLSRLWDVRRPSHVLTEARLEQRSRVLAVTGLALYWALLPLALAGLVLAWRRGRRLLVLAVVATALAAAVVYTSDATTRYRAPLEPLIVALAVSAVAAAAGRGRGVVASAPRAG